MTCNRLRLGIFCLALFSFVVFATPAILNAQSTTQGAVSGSVLDTTGAAIPGATVAIVNKATNFTVKLVSDGSGFFKAPLLEPGTYTVSIAAPNFANYRADNVTVVVGQTTPVSPRMAIASSTAEVVVTEQAPSSTWSRLISADTSTSKPCRAYPLTIAAGPHSP